MSVNSAIYTRLFNPLAAQAGGKKKAGFSKMLDILFQKKEFLVMIFANLIVQLGITYYVFLNTDPTKIKGLNTFFIVIALFAIIFIIALVPMPSWLKFILFCLFSYLQGLLLSYIKTKSNQQMIQTALVGVLSIFAFMFVFGLGLLTFGVYLTGKTGMFLFWCLLFLIIFSIVNIFTGGETIPSKVLSFFGLILFSIYIVYDTNTILQRNYSGDFITASMDYYLDIINIFLDLLNLNNN